MMTGGESISQVAELARSPEEQAAVMEAALGKLAEQLDAHSSAPLYLQVSNQIEHWIEEGRLLPGDQLASERRMTELLGVSRRTVRTALSHLIDRGYVSATHGRGNFVLEPPKRRELCFLAVERFGFEKGKALPYYYDLVHDLEEAGNLLVYYKHASSPEKLRELLLNPPGGYQGIFLFRPTQEWVGEVLAIEAELKNAPAPLLVVNRDLRGSSINFISSDHFGHACDATRRLIALGHRRIGYLAGRSSDDYMRKALEGHLYAMKEAGLELLPEDRLCLEAPGPERMEAEISHFLAGRKFTAAIAAGSMIGPSFERAVQRSAIVIPEELSALLISERMVLDGLAMRWTACIYPDEAVISRAVTALAELSRGQIRPPVQELLPHEFREGGTCRLPGGVSS